MLNIELEEFDRIYEISVELGTITYLQELVLYDSESNVSRTIRNYVLYYLAEQQIPLATELREILERISLKDKNNSSDIQYITPSEKI